MPAWEYKEVTSCPGDVALLETEGWEVVASIPHPLYEGEHETILRRRPGMEGDPLEFHEFKGHEADCLLCGEGRCHYVHGEACVTCGSHEDHPTEYCQIEHGTR